MAEFTRDVAVAAAALRRGALVAYPTETFYGLGALATLPEAVRDAASSMAAGAVCQATAAARYR